MVMKKAWIPWRGDDEGGWVDTKQGQTYEVENGSE
jgi:hypothetical protein